MDVDWPMPADALVAILQRAMMDPRFETECCVYVDLRGLGIDDLIHCTARIDGDGDVIITPGTP